MSTRPIEPGCLALVVGAFSNEGNIGKVVFVSSKADLFSDEVAWVVEGNIETPLSVGWGHALERHLLRIDGDEHVSTEQREEVSA